MTLLPRIPALFMTSRAQTARKKMAALTAFLKFYFIFNNEIGLQICCESMFYAIHIDN